VALAQAQRQVVLAEISTALLGLRSDVRRAYTQLFNTQQREEAYRDILRTSEQLVDISKKRERAGDIATLDVLQTEIVSVNARNDLQSAAYQAIEARNRLSVLLNQPLPSSTQLAPPTAFPQADLLKLPSPTPSDTITLQGSVQEATTNLENLIETALTRRPEIQELSQRLAVTQAQLSLARANRIPNLTVAAGPDIVTGDEGAFNAFIVGNLELPVFNRQQGPMAEALARQQQLTQEQAALKNRITFEIINAHTAFVSNQERIKRFETDLLPKAEQVVQMSRRAFVEGKSSILTPINAQQAYINTRLGYLQALMDYQNAISDLERAVGTGL
jgi:cobalt-zinc-cadmium efflux system outer membrane protein